ncbi:alternate-type signal peptide domain-containing protein [Paeniglutamicibacter psychrophenolicus]|uniref:Alternate signal-mediated exported protein n=1 Tax=Paeniglutamicibacter psychrophenolicus TaxID=257454 RepID=A0ABS4WD13_9MICC|nr:alternate-type signal peptide domain-containing protein [Paeniglutamicibacter psychrophenolicus]MBP2374097.1 alternate signal-mediated exported protein [Paeniglutamicibacter psychrophenolicus]
MTKGALATGLGIALLIGGGSTLAVWNVEATAHAGTITSGNMTLKAGTGTWENAAGTDVVLSTYKVVPGDKLTLTQPVEVTLEGDLMEAELTVDDVAGVATKIGGGKKAVDSFLEIEKPELFKDGKEFPEPLTPATDGKFTAKVTVTLPEETEKLDGANLSTNLSGITFRLVQQSISNQQPSN